MNASFNYPVHSGKERVACSKDPAVVLPPVFITTNNWLMQEQLILQIPEPCHEDWNKMTPVEQGRHCAVCQKNVVDFTNETDDTIIDFFKNYSGKTCGRFTDE